LSASCIRRPLVEAVCVIGLLRAALGSQKAFHLISRDLM
jgi:hypothetical protein